MEGGKGPASSLRAQWAGRRPQSPHSAAGTGSRHRAVRISPSSRIKADGRSSGRATGATPLSSPTADKAEALYGPARPLGARRGTEKLASPLSGPGRRAARWAPGAPTARCGSGSPPAGRGRRAAPGSASEAPGAGSGAPGGESGGGADARLRSAPPQVAVHGGPRRASSARRARLLRARRCERARRPGPLGSSASQAAADRENFPPTCGAENKPGQKRSPPGAAPRASPQPGGARPRRSRGARRSPAPSLTFGTAAAIVTGNLPGVTAAALPGRGGGRRAEPSSAGPRS